ncbi:MAG: hypothetical protein CL424_19835 [Acidimicrobiaceae bacterium]|nr:hypothetical protein [Acidimicrobiaceae bacterium]
MTITDDEIRTFVGRVGDAAPPAPDLEHLLNAGPTDVEESSRMWIAAAAAVLLVGGLAAIATLRPEPADAPATTPIIADAPPLTGLPFPVAPVVVPDGWSYADLYEGASNLGNDGYSSFLYRDVDTGAAMWVRTEGVDEPIGDVMDLGESFETRQQAHRQIGDTVVSMLIAGLDTDRAVDIAETLTVADVNGDRVPILDESSGLQLESSRLASEYSAGEGAVAELVLETPNGLAHVMLDSRDPDNDPWNHFGVPTPVDGVIVYEAADTARRDPIDDRIAASVHVTDPADLAAASELLASLQPTTDATWDGIADTIAADLSQVGTTHRVVIGDLVVTEHRDDDVEAFCATWHDITRCRSDRSPYWPPANGNQGAPEVHVNLVVDGLWVIAGRVTDTEPIDSPESIVGDEHTIGLWKPTDTGAFFAYALPGLTDLEVRYQGAATSGVAGFQRPIR